MNKRVAKLLELLEAHVEVQSYAGTHYGTAANKGFRNSASEQASYNKLTTRQKNLALDCEMAGFEYSLLNEIIPPPFRTTGSEREAILADLKQYAEKEYGR